MRPAEGKRRKFQSSQTSEIVLDGFVSKQPVTETAGQESEIHDNGQSFGETGKSHSLLCTVFSVSTFLTLYSSVSHTKKQQPVSSPPIFHSVSSSSLPIDIRASRQIVSFCAEWIWRFMFSFQLCLCFASFFLTVLDVCFCLKRL